MPDPSLPEAFYYPQNLLPHDTFRYVRADGSDSNTGLAYSAGAAFATIKKALSVAADGDTIFVGPGTYSETSGSGFLTVSQAFGRMVTIVSYTGNPDDVLIQGSTNNSLNVFVSTTAAYIQFRNVTFQSFGTTGASAVRITGGHDITFVGCKFLVGASTLNGFACLLMNVASGQTVANILCESCTFTNGLSVTTAYGILVTGSASGTTANLTFRYCIGSATSGPALYASTGPITNLRITGGSYSSSAAAWGAIRILGSAGTITNVSVQGSVSCTGTYAGAEFAGPISNLNIENGSYNGGTGYGLRIGQDGTTIGAVTGYARNYTATATSGHAILLGGGADNFATSDAVGTSTGLGLVFKEVTGATATRMTITGGSDSGVTMKAAINCQLTNSVINEASGVGLAVIKNTTTGNKSSGGVVTGNTFNISGTGTLDNIPGNTDLLAGLVVNDNVYHMTTSATHPYGTVYGTAALDTLAAVRTAWSTYDQPSNDSRSVAT